jgi:D-xylose transport system substrate-binding protein
MTVFKDTRQLGKEAVKTAQKMLNGENIEATHRVNYEKIDVPSILLSPVAVDMNNIDEVLIDSGYLKKEDVYVD